MWAMSKKPELASHFYVVTYILYGTRRYRSHELASMQLLDHTNVLALPLNKCNDYLTIFGKIL